MVHKPFVPRGSGRGGEGGHGSDDEFGQRPGHRPARYAQRVREELSEMIPGDLRDPRLAGLSFFTVTDVQITPDLKHATILFALMSEEARSKEVEAALNQASGFLRRELMRRLTSKITPHLIFKYDKGLTNTLEIDALLKTIK